MRLRLLPHHLVLVFLAAFPSLFLRACSLRPARPVSPEP